MSFRGAYQAQSPDARALAVVCLGAPVLRQRAKEIEDVDDDVRELVDRMLVTMYAGEGQGLAAPQVDVPRRIAVVDVPPRRKGAALALINPRVVTASDEVARGVEGCLSIPGVRGPAGRLRHRRRDAPPGLPQSYQRNLRKPHPAPRPTARPTPRPPHAAPRATLPYPTPALP